MHRTCPPSWLQTVGRREREGEEEKNTHVKKKKKKKNSISKISEKENINPARLTHISRGLQKLTCENK